MIDVLVVGAGFAGLYMLHRAREGGRTVRLVEAEEGVGGTWYRNRYPGARCDVESMAYSYSFSSELEQEWTWTERYATQPEILAYLEHVAERFDLHRDISLGVTVTAAQWDEARACWVVTTRTGETIEARFVVMATGVLSVPKPVDVPGVERFAGACHHTATWPHEGVDVAGKRVAVIGTGSSGIQVIPQLAAEAASVTVFQRSPSFSMPAFNRPLTAAEVSERKASYPAFREAARHSGFGVPITPPTEAALESTPPHRAARFEHAYREGVVVAMTSSFTDVRTDLAANDLAAEFLRDKIRQTVDDPSVAEVLAPHDHPLGSKRPCLDTAYYDTFNAAHVELVDLRATPLEEVTPDGVRTSAGEYPADVLVLATGFDALTGALTRIDIRGRDGGSLAARWADGPRTYLGLAVAGFPNLFTVTGPTSPSVLSNMIVSIEQHVDWIADAIGAVEDRGAARIEATVEAETAWGETVSTIASATMFPRARSWYMGDNVAGKPRTMLAYAGGVGGYRQICDDVAAQDYEGFVLT